MTDETENTSVNPEPVADEAAPTPTVLEPPEPPADVVPAPGSMPYRSVPTTQTPVFVTAPLRLETLWGPALSVFGALLWSFVVMGQLVTTFAPGRHDMLLGEGIGVLFVLGASCGVWVRAVRQSLRVSPVAGMAKRVERGLSLGILALLGWALAMALALVGKGAGDGVVTVFLLLVGSASFVYARRFLVNPFAPLAGGSLVLSRALWAGAGLLTFFTLIALGMD